MHLGPEWHIFHILTIEDIDELIFLLFHRCLYKQSKMASSRFIKFSETEMKSSLKKKNLKLFNNLLANKEERREIEEIPAIELQPLAIKFLLGVRKNERKLRESRGYIACIHLLDLRSDNLVLSTDLTM